MRFTVLTLFPEMVLQGCSHGVVGQAVHDGKIRVETLNPRDWTTDVHHTVDDRPFGGGDGMVMLPGPLESAVAKAVSGCSVPPRKIYLSARGRPFTDQLARELVASPEVILLCGRYGGVDQRLLEAEEFEEVSIGDYVLSGGELAALVLIDAVGRHVPGVLGNALSAENESFAVGLLEHPQFTRPRQWRDLEVPEILLGGNHAKIRQWRHHLAILITAQTRPELLANLSVREVREALARLDQLAESVRRATGLKDVEGIRLRLERRLEMAVSP
ncbi:MAG: tRNA (guanosine(37)-N1)-methyltransferase TrmD [Bdellovibrionaceae bacterium]|nr:tRNA (guanosine(37)-N1)-methyltransferase TrmD [Pseudobdellovibrionaceae bacterium]